MHPSCDPSRREARMEALRAGGLTLRVWVLLLLGASLRPWLGSEESVLVSFALALGAVLLARPRRLPGHPPGARGDGAVAWGLAALLGLAAGFASFPAWTALVGTAGLALGWTPASPTPPLPGGLLLGLATLLLAPLFEELLYRERLLPALRGLLGAPLALGLSSACFALPHAEPWPILGTFLVGLGLGSLYVAGGSVAVCVAVHAGLNLAAWVCGAPPRRLALSPPCGAVAGLALLAFSFSSLGRGRWPGHALGGVGP